MNTNSMANLALAIFLAGCTPISQLKSGVEDDTRETVSVGTVQREIKVGMSGDEVVNVLGAPNMVTTDSQRRETWVYDKVSTSHVSSNTSGGLWLIIAGVQSGSSAASTSQKSLTIIIKFDNEGRVRDYSYRQSKF